MLLTNHTINYIFLDKLLQNSTAMRKRILFLLSDTGAGHRIAAQAIAEAMHTLYPEEHETIIEDIWSLRTPWPFNYIPRAYSWLTGPGLFFWRWLWKVMAQPQLGNRILLAADRLIPSYIVAFLQCVQPDLIVSVHPMMNHVGMRWARAAGLRAPFVTVVTDMVNVHPLWICPDVDRCIVSTELAKRCAIAHGLCADKVVVYGQPVGIRFAELAINKAELRRQLGLAQDQPVVVLAGGGEGFGPIFKIAQAIDQGNAQRFPAAQLLIVTGRNRTLYARLQAARWRCPTRIYGFADNMAELMGAADILVSKAGPGTISEAFVCGLPLILYGYIPGQEAGNVDYVVANEAGVYAETPEVVAQLVRTWLGVGDPTMATMAQNVRQLARPQASLEIAQELCGLLQNQAVARRNSAITAP